VLAFLPEDVISQILAKQEHSPLTGRPMSGMREVRRELSEIKLQGYAISRGQRIAGAVGLAAPVFKGSGAVVAALCITLPEARYVESREAKFSQILMEQALKLSATLGYSPAVD
jgi:DNA-binding IclR family transcriptional regulator